MSLKRKLLAPVLMLASLVGGSTAFAQEKAPLPDAPSANHKLPQFKQTFSYQDTHPAFEYAVPKPASASSSPLGDGFIGRIAGYVDRHSNESQNPFDFAMGYKLKDRFTVMAGTLVDLRTHSGQYEANRQAVRVMTGLPDWQTRSIRDAMSGGVPDRGMHGADGFAFGIKIDLGHKR